MKNTILSIALSSILILSITPSFAQTNSTLHVTSLISIPYWIKQNAKFWSDGSISDGQFMQGMQYLIENGILKIPPTSIGNSSVSQMPTWVKNNARYWSEDSISNNEFVRSIQYLISSGMLNLQSSQAMPSDTNSTDLSKAKVQLGGVYLDVEIADTPQRQTKGLQYHTPLSYNQGMLFPFASPQVIGIWMKEMQFPIDIIWFDGSGNILHVEKNAPPCSTDPCLIYGESTRDAQYVLEVASGFVDKFGINQNSHLVMITSG
jgi:uncharacterized protein